MPNEEEIRKIMEKAKNAASGGKGPPQEKVKEKSDSGGTKKKSLEEEKTPESTKPSPEIAELKTLIIEQNQNMTRQNERIGAIENFLKEAQRQAKAQMAQETSQSNPDQIVDQPVNNENLTDEERLAQAQAEQDKKGQGVPGQSQIPTNVPLGLAYLHEFNPTFKQIAETVRIAITKGKAEKKEGSGFSFEDIGKDVVKTALERLVLGQAGGGGDNLMDQLKTFLGIQNAVVGGFFNSLKYASKDQGQAIMNNLLAQPSSPQIPPESPPPPEDHII
ncbi:hypothetical protein ES703_40713 [subsurface metagenome]